MKTNIPRPIASLVALTTLLSFAITPISMAEQKNARLEGVWDSQVTITNCSNGTVLGRFRAFDMFIHDGTLTDTNAAPNAPTSRGPGVGTWEYVGGSNGQSYTAVHRFFRFNPDGSFAGVNVVSRNIELGLAGDHYVSAVSFQVLDTNNNVVQSGCGTERALRQ